MFVLDSQVTPIWTLKVEHFQNFPSSHRRQWKKIQDLDFVFVKGEFYGFDPMGWKSPWIKPPFKGEYVWFIFPIIEQANPNFQEFLLKVVIPPYVGLFPIQMAMKLTFTQRNPTGKLWRNPGLVRSDPSWDQRPLLVMMCFSCGQGGTTIFSKIFWEGWHFFCQ